MKLPSHVVVCKGLNLRYKKHDMWSKLGAFVSTPNLNDYVT